MDPLEEFEIKPLSDGLGFHKKSIPLHEQIKNSGLLEAHTAKIPASGGAAKSMGSAGQDFQRESKRDAFADLLKTLESPSSLAGNSSTPAGSVKGVSMSETLPPPGTFKKKAAPEIERPRPGSMPEFPNLGRKTQQPSSHHKNVDDLGLKRGASDSSLKMLEKAPVSIGAAILDGIVVFALSLVFLVALMTVTKVDLAHLVLQVGLDVPTQLAFGVLFLTILLMYVVVTRSFFGCTLGEWTFDYQMGDDLVQKKISYPLKVFWRGLLVVVTGLVPLSLLSLLLRRDLLASLTGLQLYKQK